MRGVSTDAATVATNAGQPVNTTHAVLIALAWCAGSVVIFGALAPRVFGEDGMSDIAVMTRRGRSDGALSPMTVASAAAMPTIPALLMSVSFGKMIIPLASLAEYVAVRRARVATMGVLGRLSTAMAAHQTAYPGSTTDCARCRSRWSHRWPGASSPTSRAMR